MSQSHQASRTPPALRPIEAVRGGHGMEPVMWWLTVTRYQALGPKELGIWFRIAAKTARVDVMV